MLKTQICVTRPHCVNSFGLYEQTFLCKLHSVYQIWYTECINIIYPQRPRIIHREKPNKMQQCINIYYSIFIWNSTCFGRHTAHHQEPKTARAASGFCICGKLLYVWLLEAVSFQQPHLVYSRGFCLKTEHIAAMLWHYCSWDSSVDVVTRVLFDYRRELFEFLQEQEISLVSKTTRLILGCIQPPIQWGPRLFLLV